MFLVTVSTVSIHQHSDSVKFMVLNDGGCYFKKMDFRE